MKKRFDLQLFTEGGDTGGSGGTGGAAGSGGNGGQGSTGGGASGASYSYEQAEQIAEARADRASKAALDGYFKQQGVSAEEAAAALADYKEKKAAQHPGTSAAERERDEALAKLAEMENTNYLRDKGVKADDLDYVLFKASKMVDEKTDFKKAADAFLKENPRYTGKGFRIVSTGLPNGGSGKTQAVNDSINSAIRAAFGR